MSDFNLPGGQFGPVLRGGRYRRGPDWRRIAVLLGALVGMLALLGAAGAGALIWYGESRIGRVAVDGISDSDAQAVKDVLNVLVVGSDSRDGLTREQLRALGTDDHGGKLTDTIILIQLDPNREKVALLSFPRDLLVTRCDDSRGRINAAYSRGVETGAGGPTCLVQTVAEFTGIPVHHYVEVDFAGFITVVDTLGGVTMYFDEPLRDRSAGLDVEAGCVHLDGVRALGFVRARKDLDSDFGRIARQQRFIRELMGKAMSAGTLLNVPRLFSLVNAVGSAVDADEGLSLSVMRRLAFSLRNLTPERVDMRTVPAKGRRVSGASYVVAEEDKAQVLFTAFREGTLIPEGLGAEGSTEIGVADVPPLVLLNGAGVAGLAAEAQEALEARGYRVEATGNTSTFGRATTQVYFTEERREEAELLAKSLPGAELVPESYAGGQDVEATGPITVVLGEDFDADALPSPAPSAPDGEEPPPVYAGATPSEHDC